MHEALIILVIIIIVATQAFVGFTAWKKIDAYKQIIPEAQHFETVKVYIHESQVKDINVNYILANISKFQLPREEKEQFVEAEIIEDTVQIVTAVEPNEEEPEPGYEDLIWVTKGNDEKKIKYKLLASYQQNGWSRL